MKNLTLFVCFAFVSLFASQWVPYAHALINPSVQPRTFFDTYNGVYLAEVQNVDSANLSITLFLHGTAKGTAKPDSIVLKALDRKHLAEVLSVAKGQNVVIFAGRDRPRSAAQDVLCYVGGGKFIKARMADGDWELLGDADEGVDRGSADIMFGVFNGAVEQLWAMMEDFAKDRAYFPAVPFTRFSAAPLVKLDKPVRGVAVFDVNRDGSLDIVATSEAGARVFVQNAQAEFEDKTSEWGIEGIASRSVSLADANGDGAVDLLLDGLLYLQKNGKWERTEHFPAQVKVLSAAFVELNQDGYPDVVISRDGGGLAAFVNRLHEEKGFEDWTKTLALDQEESGAGGSGYFEAADWNGDGRTDLLYLSGPGYLLTAGESGSSMASVTLNEEGNEVDFGAAAAAPIVTPGTMAVLVPNAETKMLLEFDDKVEFRDIIRYGNEIQDDVPGLYMALAEDLNADGRVDLYISANAAGSPSFYVDNRGYGSFMMPDKYAQQPTFPSAMYNQAANGLAAGDLTGDGANDLVVGGKDGTLWIATNETLKERPEEFEVSTRLDERKQIMARLVTVRFEPTTGVVGARLELLDAEGQLVAARAIGSNIGTGCSGPHQVVFAVREPGAHKLRVRFSDGTSSEMAVDLSSEEPRHQTVTVSARK